MGFAQILFYVIAAIMLFAALRMITVRNPVHAALYLVLCFICASVLWLLLEAEFLAIVLVLVYVGAVMVLFLFVIMMLDINTSSSRDGFVKYLPVGALIAGALFMQITLVIGPKEFGFWNFKRALPAASDYSNTEVLGKALYSDYLYPLEIAAVILLVAIIAAITLTLRKRPDTKRQNPAKQIQVQKQDRLRIVKMKAEK